MKRTEQRTALLEEIKTRADHPTAYDLYHAIREKLPHISLGTVYRNLEYLSENGIIRKIESTGGQKRFDPTTEDHPHFRCIECGRVEDIPIGSVPDVSGLVGHQQDGRLVLGVNLEYVGLCSECAVKQETQNTSDE